MGVDIFLMVAITIISGFVFFRNVKPDQKPSILAWLIALLTTTIALGSYIMEQDHITVDALAKGSLFFANTTLCLFIVVRLAAMGGWRYALRWFDWVSLAVSALVVIYWFTSDDPFGANLAIQALMIVSYGLVIRRVVESRGQSDDIWFWSTTVTMSFISIISSLGGETLELVNTWRSVASTGIVFALLIYFRSNKRT